MAPNWISTAKVLPKSSSAKPKKRCTSSRCPVEETGTNSVRPSTMPRTIALIMSKVMRCSAGNVAVARAESPELVANSQPGQWQRYDVQQDAPGGGTNVPIQAMTGWDFFAALLVCTALIP